MKKLFSEEDINFMKAHYKEMSYREIGLTLGFTEGQIKGKLNNMGYTKLRNFNKYYFRKIDSDIKAYFLGFIYADGCISYNSNTRNYELSIALQSQDKYILDKLNNELGNVHKIQYLKQTQRTICGIESNIKESCLLRIYSKDIVLDLINHGVIVNKSYNPSIPKIQEEYFFDFLRGLIDGDGCYWKSKSNTYLHITEGTRECLDYISSILQKYDIKTSVRKENDHKYRLFCTNYKSMNILIHKIYHSNFSLCLSRKYKKIEHFLQDGSAI